METINRWDALPEECKSLILSRLSTKEVARIARVCKEFLRAVNVLRSSVQLLVLPPNLSVTALEGMVSAHPNVRSLSFKRCGAKLRSFVPIIKAAAAGYVTVAKNDRLDSAVEKRRGRSLTAIDFRNCTNLIDTDVNILCSLHSRLEEVDLTNCPFMSDAALLTLSRYQHIEKPDDPLERYNCYPRFLEKSSKVASDTCTEDEELFLRNNDAAVYEEIRGLGLNSSNFRSWPRIGERARKENAGHLQVSSRKYEEAKIIAASPSLSLSKRGDSSVTPTPYMGLKKSFAQMAAKSLEKTSQSISAELDNGKGSATPYIFQPLDPAEPDLLLPSVEEVSPRPLNFKPSKPADVDPALTFIDWSLSNVDTRVAKSDYQDLGDMGLLCSSEYCSTSSIPLVAEEELSSEVAATNRYRDMYKHYLIDEVQDSTCALPDLIDKLCLNVAHKTALSQAHYQPTMVQVDEGGSKYRTVETSASDNQMMRSQTSLFISKLPYHGVQGIDLLKQKTTCVAGGSEIKDQRVHLDPLRKAVGMTPNGNSEAFCRTMNHVGIFAVPDADSKGGFDLRNLDEMREGTSKSNHLERHRHLGLREIEDPSQLAICLPDVTNIGGILRRNMQPLQPLESFPETSMGPDNSAESEAHLEMGIDVSSSVPGLRSVCVANCPEITDRGVQALLKGTSRTCLSTLDVSRCGGVTNAGLKLPVRSGLQHLIAVQMPAINRLVYQLPIQSVLQHLNLAGCYKLQELMLVASSLKTLNLSNCKKLIRLHLKCPSLTALNLSLCDGLERFVKFQCSALQSANFMGCRMLLQSALNAAVNSAASLEDLRCGGCDRVERLDLLQTSLLTLDVSGSQSLKRLFCQSKVLRVVDACGCKTLAEVYLYSPYLRRILFSNCALLQILVIPLDAIKETMDSAVSQRRKNGIGKLDELEISISGCNMPEMVKKNLAKLSKQWHSCFKSTS